MHVNVSVVVKTVDGISLFDGRKLEESEGYNNFMIIFYELESKYVDQQFVGHLYEYKPLVLRACDMIYFKTDLQTVTYYSTNHF